MEKEKVVIVINDTDYFHGTMIIKGSQKELELLKAIKERGFFGTGIEIKTVDDDYIIEV